MSDARRLPRVDVIADALDGAYARTIRVEAARVAIGEAREALLAGHPGAKAVDEATIVARAGAWLEALARPRLRRVINATGVVIHTNLGRAPLPADALAEALGYCNLEYDLKAGERGSRRALCEARLVALSGAEAALVVNNCAAALVLTLAALADGAPGREVIVSRGELVEIGGSFRIPEILAASGVRLREVGTTNRTYAKDYEGALSPATIAVLRVHPSNFKLSGFVARPTLDELAATAHAAGLPLVVDLGSEALAALPGLDEPGADDLAGALAAGADLVLFSGDKLLGGPQAGIALGRRALIERLARHPLMRALRPDKLALAALDHVLMARQLGQPERVPLLAMLALDRDHLRARAERLRAELARAGVATEPVDTDDPIGGGSHPERTLPGAGLALPGGDHLHAALRGGHPPVVATLREGRLQLALRTVAEADEPALVAALCAAIARTTTRALTIEDATI